MKINEKKNVCFYEQSFSFVKKVTKRFFETPAEKESGKILPDVRKAACFLRSKRRKKAAGTPITRQIINRVKNRLYFTARPLLFIKRAEKRRGCKDQSVETFVPLFHPLQMVFK
ncbi:MAG: hypothetical protein EA344_02085, partial [Alkalicoccus sp.]